MIEWMKNNALALTIGVASIVASYSVNTALYGYRITAVEARQDRQGVSISSLQTSLADVTNQYSALNAKLEGIDNTVNYIRSRIDAGR